MVVPAAVFGDPVDEDDVGLFSGEDAVAVEQPEAVGGCEVALVDGASLRDHGAIRLAPGGT